MKTFKNEKGYALLMVLMLILLFTVLGMGLMATNMNSAKQFNTKEEQVKARHQAEMGVLHYQAQLISIVEENKNNEVVPCAKFLNEVAVLSNDNNSEYNVSKQDIECELSEDVIKISIESTGKYIDKEDKIKAKFNIKNSSRTNLEEGELPGPSDYNDDTKVVEGGLTVENGFYSPTEDSLYVKGDFKVQHGNSNGGNDILINRNLFIDQNMSIQNHACIVTRGNLIVKGNITSTNKVYIFVYGDAYFKSNTYKSSNNNFFVTGKVFENGKEVRNDFEPVPSGYLYNYHNGSDSGNDKKTCPLPGSGNPGKLSGSWQIDENIDVDYFVN
ncbi:hypothetical protein [Planococcus halotolerans]|uniref:Type 4 fimbrial biogenesis protein PilX N-terminal domain-containing protein n=1 Tax=Planococcus halotolerans TaxID=2233542 RepID=A0A365KLU6_9BACL|nr:hypothetical protein [Planococcus halotolerans]QHJ71660.1 hypothetical protein DNR44_013930 [Planococcus halotolerans]RAZ74124.1 hypothetical protein DP120_16215 [Planococcus halotolerans]